MIYKTAIKKAMGKIAEIENSIFVGYNLRYGSKAYGTLDNIPENKILETPLSESLMTGMAIGMALDGKLPILFFERHDFMLLAADQIINHLSKIQTLSDGQFNPKVIIRATIGHNKPFDPGIQHLQNFTDLFKKHCHFLVFDCNTPDDIERAYYYALNDYGTVMIIEHRELY
jgi:acetoin:2,6-dichlorophenolindophenol oxidoreductase subunit beta